MLRKFVVGLCVLLLGVGVLIAAEIKGRVKSIDDTSVTVTSEGKDHVIAITDDTEIVNPKGKALDRTKALKQLKAGRQVVVTCEKKEGKEVATKIQLGGGKKKKKDQE